MRPRRPLPRLLAPIVLMAAAVCFVRVYEKGSSSPAQNGGAVGLETGITTPEPSGPLISPAGRKIQPGTVDERGYRLPLDVRRARPHRPAGRPPSDSERGVRRAQRTARTYEEHRLGLDDGHTQNETVIDGVADTLVAGWNNFTDGSLVMGVARSVDAGHTWSFDLITGHTAMSDPVVKAGRNGNWYFAYIARGGAGGSDFDVFVRRSTDAGASWGAPTNVTNDGNFDDKPFMDAAGNDVVIGYADFGSSPAKVRAVRSVDGAQTFTHDTIVSVNSGSGNGAHPIIGPDGTWFIFWRDSYQDSLWVAHSSDRGLSWSPDRGIVGMAPLPSSLPPGFRIVNLPVADANPVTATLIVVWNDQRFGDPDILCIRSVDGATTWSEPIRVNDDTSGRAQFFPWITIDENGVVHVVWYDRREDGYGIDVYYARSLDDGISFETNVRVTAASFAPVLPWEGGAADFIGDYNAVAATPGTVFPCYQDARAGVQDVYVALLPNVSAGIGDPSTQSWRMLPSAAPNPWRTATRIQFGAGPPGRIVEVVTVTGRRLARIQLDPQGNATWDGRDDRGRAVPPGIYFARPAGWGAGGLRLIRLPQ